MAAVRETADKLDEKGRPLYKTDGRKEGDSRRVSPYHWEEAERRLNHDMNEGIKKGTWAPYPSSSSSSSEMITLPLEKSAITCVPKGQHGAFSQWYKKRHARVILDLTKQMIVYDGGMPTPPPLGGYHQLADAQMHRQDVNKTEQWLARMHTVEARVRVMEENAVPVFLAAQPVLRETLFADLPAELITMITDIRAVC